ncbi:DEAD/DEAH box helicase family protein [Streptomyces sp. LN245]|uniref:DEAD/DEAH box helicase family protein n=1 Tax=Streptomyces sp. LN245 TaxID=3112975 RepID=UPI00371EDFB1
MRKWVGFPARSSVPPEGVRGTGVSATGSGKTITAAWAALENFRDGRILVMVPTLDLLVQTIHVWRRIGHRSLMIAVCSLENDPVLNELGVRTTTNPIQLALWTGHGPVIVFATYASLVDRAAAGPLHMERLFATDLDPGRLTDELRRPVTDLGGRARDLYGELLRLCCAHLVEQFTAHPAFAARAAVEHTRRTGALLRERSVTGSAAETALGFEQ